MSKRIIFDVSTTLKNSYNTGIQKIVINLAEEFLANRDHEKWEIIVVVSRRKFRNEYKFYEVKISEIINRKRFKDSLKIPHKATIAVLYEAIVRNQTLQQLFERTVVFTFLRKIRELAKERIYFNFRETRYEITEIEIQENDYYLNADVFWNSFSAISKFQYLKEKGARISILIHDIFPISNPEWFLQRDVTVFQRVFSEVIRGSTLLFCNSQFTADEVYKNMEIVDRPKVIRIGIENDILCEWSDFDHQAQSRETNLVFIGTLEPRKNYTQILTWLSEMNFENQVDIVGRRGWNDYDIHKTLEKVKAKGLNVTWHGALSNAQIRSLIGPKSVGICGSLAEGYGLPLREFRLNGIPVVASRIPTFLENIDDRGIFYFDLENQESFSSALHKAQKTLNRNKVDYPIWRDSVDDILKEVSITRRHES